VAERTKVLENIRNDYNALLAQERSFAGQLQDQQAAVTDLDKKSGDYKILQRKADSERAVGQPHLRRSVDEEHHFVKRHLTSRWVERTFGLVGSYTSF